MATVPYPKVNGVRHDWTSIRLGVDGEKILGVKAVTYKHSLKGAKVWGTPANAVGRTRGKYDAEGSLELYRSEADSFIAKLTRGGSIGYME